MLIFWRSKRKSCKKICRIDVIYINDNREDCVVINEKNNVKGFFESLLFCVKNSELGIKWDREVLDELFEDMGKLFDETMETVQVIPWDVMKENIEKTNVYNNTLSKVGKIDKVNEYMVYQEYIERSRIKESLLKIDDEIIGGRFTWVVQSNYCGPDIEYKDATDKRVSRRRDNFEKIIKEIDVDGKIEKLFRYTEMGKAKKRWIFNAIDSKKFYETLSLVEGTGKELDIRIIEFARKNIYEKYCYDDAWKINYNKWCKLIEMYPFKRESETDVFITYKCYEEITRYLCNLLPVIEFDGNTKKIKGYKQWRKEQVLISEVIGKRRLELMIDPYEKRAYELVLKNLHNIAELNDYKDGNDYVKDLYLDYIGEGAFQLEEKIRILNRLGKNKSWEGKKNEFIKTLYNIHIKM